MTLAGLRYVRVDGAVCKFPLAVYVKFGVAMLRVGPPQCIGVRARAHIKVMVGRDAIRLGGVWVEGYAFIGGDLLA